MSIICEILNFKFKLQVRNQDICLKIKGIIYFKYLKVDMVKDQVCSMIVQLQKNKVILI